MSEGKSMNEWIRSALGRGPLVEGKPNETLLQEFYREEAEREAAQAATEATEAQERGPASINAGAGTLTPPEFTRGDMNDQIRDAWRNRRRGSFVGN